MSKNSSSTTRFKGDITNMNIVVTVLAVIANFAVLFTLFNATKFSNLSGKTFILVNVISIILLIVMNVTLMTGIRSKQKPVYFTGVLLVAVFLFIGVYGAYAMAKVNKNVNKITASTTEESVSTSLVVYSASGGAPITDISNLDGKTVGLATGTHTAELGKARIESEKMTVSYTEYQDYSSEMLALLNGEIDCAVLPTNYVNIFGNEPGMEEFLGNTSSILDFEETITVQNAAGSDKDLTKDPFTVLLIGNADGLSDTMILCSVNPISMKVTMSSLARDSYVPITCYGGNSSKLNAAHAVSRDCLIATIEKLVGVEIDYYVDTNFKGVVQVVDALGGIVVNSPIEFVGQNSDSSRGAYTVWVPAGDNVLLNGEQALAFARERHLFATGDFARQEHQQEVIEAILRKIMRTRDINTLLDVMDAAGENIQTNMSLSQMTGFMSYALQKANRYYNQDQVEKVMQLQHSRVTGYSSGLWDDGLQMSLYIYRLWQGSLADTKKAIERNIDMTTPIDQSPTLQWSVNWDFYVPTISAEVYSEAIIPSTAPTTLGNYVGRSLGSIQSFCNAQGIPLSVSYVADSSQADGIIISQSVGAGTPISSISGISVTVVQNSGGTTTPTTSASEVKSESACTTLGYYWSTDLGKCYTNSDAASPDEKAAKAAADLQKQKNECNNKTGYKWVDGTGCTVDGSGSGSGQSSGSEGSGSEGSGSEGSGSEGSGSEGSGSEGSGSEGSGSEGSGSEGSGSEGSGSEDSGSEGSGSEGSGSEGSGSEGSGSEGNGEGGDG
ncbi:MAG: LCP family protein [Solobacterium sp.]|nr:LCP family protein [Solobacterium sp.]